MLLLHARGSHQVMLMKAIAAGTTVYSSPRGRETIERDEAIFLSTAKFRLFNPTFFMIFTYSRVARLHKCLLALAKTVEVSSHVL